MTTPILAVDLGTTSCKAVLVDDNLEVLHSETVSYEMFTSSAGAAEQDPLQVVLAAEQCVARVVDRATEAPAAMVLSSAMHSLMALDAEAAPMTRLLTWADRRAEAVAQRLRSTAVAERLSRETGTPVHASSPLCKLIWLRENQPEVFEQASAFVSMKEFLLRRWCDACCVDSSIASASGLFDLASGGWHTEALRVAELGAERLSEIVPTTAVIETWRGEVASRLGIAADLPLVLGASDGALANLGVGAVREDVVAVSMGTSGAARRTVAAASKAAPGMFCYVLDADHYVTGGAINNVGLALTWVASRFLGSDADGVERLLSEAESSPLGARGLRCRPRLAGERYPDYGSATGGSFEGLSLEHERADLFRAAVEGVVWSVAALVRSMPGVAEIRAGGGVLRSPFVRQMLADMCGIPVRMPETEEVSGLGAVWLARHALGEPGVFAKAAAYELPVLTAPDMDRHRRYVDVLAAP